MALLTLVFIAFWIWMIYDCLKNGNVREGGYLWIFVLLFFNVVGAALYFFVVWLPNNPNASVGKPWVNRGKLRNALWQAEADAKNIGNAHQYLKLGELHYQMGDLEAAKAAYHTALEKESNNLQALWAISRIAEDQKDFATTRQFLETLMSLQPDFSYGDASFAYCSALYQLGEMDIAQVHLQKHLKSWSHPPIYIMLAEIYQQQGDKDKARELLETMIMKVRSSPQFHYRKYQKCIPQAQRLLKKLS